MGREEEYRGRSEGYREGEEQRPVYMEVRGRGGEGHHVQVVDWW